MKNEKLILTDIDGCLLNWEGPFCTWFETQGYSIQMDDPKLTYNLADRYGITLPELMKQVRVFNESEELGKLPPHRDAVEYIAKLINDGYRFIAITAMSNSEEACMRRVKHLEETFGTVFDEFIFLDTGADKTEVLEEFRDSRYYWIEDKIENAQAGLDVGLNAIIMEHGFNMHSDVAPLIKNWKHFYDEYINSSN